MSSKRTHKCLSISEKKACIQAVVDGKKKSEVAKRFNIPPSTLTSILKKKEIIAGIPSSSKAKRQKCGEFPELERSLVTWFAQCRQLNVPVGGVMMREKAKFFAERLAIDNFRASDGWFDRFKKRHNISFRKLSGESASVSDNVCLEWKGKLSELINNYQPMNIFNADETGLFFKCLPDRSMCFKDEKCHGGKNSKDRVTVLLAANMDGTEKLKPLMIGKSAKPRCFKNIKSFPMIYRSNRKAWMTSEVFHEWLKLLNNDMARQNRKILLFIDNCTAHNNTSNLSHVKVEFLPANTTSKLQPLDQGIIKNFKTFYRKEVVQLLLNSIEEGTTHSISLLSAMSIADKAWQNVSQTTIQNCFRACGFVKEGLHTCANYEHNFSIDVDTLDWDRLPQSEEITFDDFVHFDDDLAVTGILTDEDILAEEDGEISDDDGDDAPTISFKEAKACINTLRQFMSTHLVKDDVFSAIVTLDNNIDRARQQSLRQKKITDFF